MISELQKTAQLVVMVVMASSSSSLLKAAAVTFYENNGSLLDVCVELNRKAWWLRSSVLSFEKFISSNVGVVFFVYKKVQSVPGKFTF
jgi:uncharacterized membrane protein